MASVRSLSSRWLAACCAVGYLVVSTVLGTALLVQPAEPAVVGAMPTPNAADRGAGAATTTTLPPPTGFEQVSGPEEVQTVIPVGWRIARAGGPGAMRATDPSDGGRFVGFGGVRTASPDLADVRTASETLFAERANDYERISLNRATYAGHEAIEWEYQHDDGSGPQHVRALYWLVDGVEYFIYASGPETQWPRMLPVYDAMVANSRP